MATEPSDKMSKNMILENQDIYKHLQLLNLLAPELFFILAHSVYKM